MDYEKKYKEALEVAQRFYNNSAAITKKGLEDIFPVLKEPEDEKIRKRIIKHLEWCENNQYLSAEEMNTWLAWLEKQGQTFTKKDVDDAYLKGISDAKHELEKQGEHANFINKIQIGDKVTRNEDGVLVNLSQLKRVAKKDEKQGEQKPQRMTSAKAKEAGYDTPKPELTEFEKAVRDIITSELCNNFGDVSFGVSISDDEANMIAKKLLPVARKQFIEEACEWLKENIYYRVCEQGDMLVFPTAEFIKDFRKALEKGESV